MADRVSAWLSRRGASHLFREGEFKCFIGIACVFGVALSIALILQLVPAAAQVDRASLTGTVTDATGAVIVAAKVMVTHEGSGLVREGEVGTGGAYMIPQLPIGFYTVKMEAGGFRSIQFDKVQLLVGQTRTLDAKLDIASAATAIEVRDIVAALDRSSAEIGTVVQSTQVSELPINGRNWASLMVLAAGAVNTGEGFQDDVRFAGRANDDNNWTFDGIDNTAIKDPTYGTSARLIVSMDSISEFRVSSSLYSADSGGGMGGQVHLVSKSGSNQFHGGVFEYLRNNAFDARTIFDGPKLAPFRLNQFGGNMGGPIKANKLFFFGNYEGLRQRQSSVYTYNVPSPALRDRVIAGAPNLQSLIEAYPLGARPTKDANVDELVQSWSQRNTEDSMMGRIDYQISDRTTVFGRYNGNTARLAVPGGLRPEYVDTENQHTKNLMLQLQHTFSPAVVNETRVGAHRVPRIEEDFGAFNETVNLPAGLTALPNNNGMKEIGTSYSVINNLSVFRGRHNLKFGGEVRRVHVNVWWTAARSATFASVNDFVRDAVDSVSISGEMATRGGRRTLLFGYAQDEFKASRTLTLSLGARYEYYSVMKEVRDRILVFDKATGDFAPQGTPAYNPDRDNIAPRASFAWAPDLLKQKTVIRGGYGMYYGPGQMDDVMAGIESTQETFRLTSADVAGLSYPIEPFLSQAKAQGLTPRHIMPNRRDMYSQNWGLSIQQLLPSSFTMQVGYVGNNAHKILSRTYINLINPATGLRQWSKFGRIDSKEDAGNSSFNALQVSLKRRMTSGLMWQTEYMWSHGLNDGMIGGGESTAPQNANDRRAGKADSNYDIRQTMTTNVVWQLPFGPGQRFLRSKAAGRVVGGWELGGIHSTRTGRAITFTVSRSSKDLPDGNSSNQRPDVVPGVSIYPETQTIDHWFNLAAFAVPAKGTWGNAARNLGRGPGVNQFDMSLQKTAHISENHRIAFRAEFFNILNRPHLGTPASNISSPGSFGRITSPMNRTIGIGTARQIQFMLRYMF